ncbi:MAG: HTH domain-containing protein [Candidatus Woesearchaeota archaeon]
MDIRKLAKTLEGLYTIEMIAEKLNISRRTAINYVSSLRKQGYLTTTRGHKKLRLYRISPLKMKLDGNIGLFETINKYSNIKLNIPFHSRIHGRKFSVEEAIIEAIKTKDYRIIIAAMPLFNHIKSWSLLAKYAKENDVTNKVGALYDLTKKIVRIKKIDKRTENSLMKNNSMKNSIKRYKGKVYLIPELKKEKDFKEISKKWNVIIGLRKGDLLRLKE